MATRQKKCTPARHKALANQRKRQAKYVEKHKTKHAAAVKKSETKNKSKVAARKQAAAKKGGKPTKRIGRPRTC